MPLYPLVEKKVGHGHKFQQGKDVGDEETKLEIILNKKVFTIFESLQVERESYSRLENDEGGY